MKWDVIYKFCLLCMLIAGLVGILFSGLGIYFQWPIQGIFQWHLGSALLLILGVALHFFNRKNKAVKIVQQFTDLVTHNRYPTYCNLDRLIMTFEHFSILQIAEQLQLNPSILFSELANGKINFSDANRTLRENFPHNDEKIFRRDHHCIEVTFHPQPKRMFQWKRNCFASPLVWLACLLMPKMYLPLVKLKSSVKNQVISAPRVLTRLNYKKITKIECLM